MEDLLMFKNFSIKSSIKESYSVNFIDNIDKCLFEIADKGNVFFVIDSKVELIYELSKLKPLSNCNFIQIISQVFQSPNLLFV